MALLRIYFKRILSKISSNMPERSINIVENNGLNIALVYPEKIPEKCLSCSGRKLDWALNFTS